MKCQSCGAELPENALFCSVCGTKNEPRPAFCPGCGAPLGANASFCSACGRSVGAKPNGASGQGGEKRSGFSAIVDAVNNMTGETGRAEIHMRELFSEVTQRHSSAERDELVICGTHDTTPEERKMVGAWPKPWFFARVFLSLLLVFVGLYIMSYAFQNTLALPGLMFIGAMLVPFSVLIFFWEINVPRNISIVDCVQMFFVGGVLSLVLLHIISLFVRGSASDSYGEAILVGITEELAKLLIAAFYIRKRNCKYLLNGLLIGACVGAGFAVFESAGYALDKFIEYGFDFSIMMRVIVLRALLAVGGHVTWTAMTACGLVSEKGEDPFAFGMVFRRKSLCFLLIAIVLHAIWDMPIQFGSEIFLIKIILTVIIIVIVLIQVSAGLRQVVRLSNAAQERYRAEHPGAPVGSANA